MTNQPTVRIIKIDSFVTRAKSEFNDLRTFRVHPCTVSRRIISWLLCILRKGLGQIRPVIIELDGPFVSRLIKYLHLESKIGLII